MKRPFADTSYFVALSTPRDQWHSLAKQFARDFGADLITTEFVLVETGNFLCRWPTGRDAFLALEIELRGDKNVTIIPASCTPAASLSSPRGRTRLGRSPIAFHSR